ncbi:MAG: NADH-quinone oxidoreductase subunit N [Stackebrandtia sp.]
MKTQAIDHLALLPAYLAAATVVAALLADLIAGRRTAVLATTAAGVLATAGAAIWVGTLGRRETFCTADGCSYVTTEAGALVVVVLCALTLAVLALSAPSLRSPDGPPAGEYAFLLACSLAGGIVLAYARDLITIAVALETLTLPLYVLVAMRRKEERSAESAVTFLLVSVAASAVTLFGAALLYAVTGTVQLRRLAEALTGDTLPLTGAAVAMIIAGMAFKTAAVPLHGWAPGTYDGAPLPIAAYLSTASKLGGVVALVWVVTEGLAPVATLAGPVLAVLAVATMTVGNLVALRQTRAVRLLAWSSIAQAGYLLAPLGAIAATPASGLAATATAVIGFAVFYVIMELAAFGALIGLRGEKADGGELADYTGAARRSPLTAAVLILALTALAGLPPGLAGLFAKITVMSAVASAAPWLAVVIAVNAVIGLVYYLRFSVLLLRPHTGATPPPTPWPVTAAITLAALAALAAGFAPQLILGFA